MGRRFVEYYIPVLKVLNDMKEHEINDIYTSVADLCNLSSEELEEKTRSGNQPRWRSNVQWAITDLCQGGFIERKERGVYKMSFEGMLMLEDNPQSPDRDYLESRSALFRDFVTRKGTRKRSDNESEDNLFSGDNYEYSNSDRLQKEARLNDSTNEAREMLKNCYKLRADLVKFGFSSSEVDAKIILLEQGLVKNAITIELDQLMGSIKSKNLCGFALMVDCMFDTSYKIFITKDSKEVSKICNSGELIWGFDNPESTGDEESPIEIDYSKRHVSDEKAAIKQKDIKQKQSPFWLKVKMEDGHVIEDKYAADVFAKVIEEIGPEKVERLGIVYAGIPLVSQNKPDKYQSKNIAGKWYVSVNIPTPIKKKLLHRIASQLNLNINIEIGQ